jgi:hypothetical protein
VVGERARILLREAERPEPSHDVRRHGTSLRGRLHEILT